MDVLDDDLEFMVGLNDESEWSEVSSVLIFESFTFDRSLESLSWESIKCKRREKNREGVFIHISALRRS